MTEKEIQKFRNEDFLSKEITIIVNHIDEKSKALWGMMSSQHMFEHLRSSISISNGEKPLEEQPMDDEKRQQRLKFLMSDAPFEKNILVSGLTEPKLRDLKYDSFDRAKSEFFKSLINFFGHFDKNKNQKYFHPAFGMLGYEEWIQFHFKHIRHHFAQFGVNVNL